MRPNIYLSAVISKDGIALALMASILCKHQILTGLQMKASALITATRHFQHVALQGKLFCAESDLNAMALFGIMTKVHLWDLFPPMHFPGQILLMNVATEQVTLVNGTLVLL